MKYNTPKQRKKIYEKAISYIEGLNKDEEIGLCIIIGDIIFEEGFDSDECPCEFSEDYMPELHKQKPKNANYYGWWKSTNHKRRIKALEDAIKLCK